jgi:hypothetical protein
MLKENNQLQDLGVEGNTLNWLLKSMIGWGGLVSSGQNSDRWGALVNTAMNLLLPQIA